MQNRPAGNGFFVNLAAAHEIPVGPDAGRRTEAAAPERARQKSMLNFQIHSKSG